MRVLIIFTVFFATASCEFHKEIKHIVHPLTGEELTVLVIAGVGDDITYLIDGRVEDSDYPEGIEFVAFNDSFGVTTEGNEWVVYFLGDIYDSYYLDDLNIIFRKIDKVEYRALISNNDISFLYTYYF